tara:strand:+ start:787 stop:1077 length:291 start_codon:yes stop_codon:yes gene_type:complete
VVVEKASSGHQFLRVRRPWVFDFCCRFVTCRFGLSNAHPVLAGGSLLAYAFDIARVFDFGEARILFANGVCCCSDTRHSVGNVRASLCSLAKARSI